MSIGRAAGSEPLPQSTYKSWDQWIMAVESLLALHNRAQWAQVVDLMDSLVATFSHMIRHAQRNHVHLQGVRAETLV